MGKLTDSHAWRALLKIADQIKAENLRIDSLFAKDANRFNKYSLLHDQLLLDYSKQLVTDDALQSLLDLAHESNLTEAIDQMFSGKNINLTENRAVLHTALRRPPSENQPAEVAHALQQMEQFVGDIQDLRWLGADKQAITTIVNIGIGGSDLGPAMVVDALADFAQDGLTVHFVSNVDPSHIRSVLQQCSAGQTLFTIASKSFTTLETHQNANAARRWFLDCGFSEKDIAKHFVAVTSNLAAAEAFGIETSNVFPMWDWVGGRYSLWSAIGLPIALAVGMENFKQMLAGAHTMDEHFQHTPLTSNLPVMLGLIGIWNVNFLGAHSTAVVPYSQRLNQFPAFLQQLTMESLGKRVNLHGEAVDYRTGEIIWGSAGTNSQHSYFQLLHQGTEFVPVELIGFCTPHYTRESNQHQHLLANFLSQSKALMDGDTDIDDPHKYIAGNKPSTTLLIDQLSPSSLGSLIALYEHKVFVQSVIWQINAFDQWGVQLGKVLSEKMTSAIDVPASAQPIDSSTQGLIAQIRRVKETPL
ncbi:MAG: glucose-6-phosphate isomerase [Pseudohongiellaceae bacterium]|jgi:glucose-6-phosphate isomerase